MACSHSNLRVINDVRVCLKCGLTLTKDGKVIFDRPLVDYVNEKKGRGKKHGKD